MKMKKQFLSILLSLVMVLGLMPGMGLTAYAETTEYDNYFVEVENLNTNCVSAGICSKTEGLYCKGLSGDVAKAACNYLKSKTGSKVAVVYGCNVRSNPNWTKIYIMVDGTPKTDTYADAPITYIIGNDCKLFYVKSDAPDFETVSATVTFKVLNGQWDNGTTEDVTVSLSGLKDTVYLASDQIPAVGSKPNDTYKAGSWDVTPSTDTAITADTTYTYTYAQKEAATVTKAPEAKTLTYTGSAQSLVTAGTATGGEMQYALGTATKATQPYTTTIPTATEAGTYYVWYKVKGNSSHTDTEAKCIEVTINPVDSSPAVSNKALSFTGQLQPLVTAGTVSGGTLQYALGTDANTAPADGWSTEIPMATEAGTYYVWYRIKGDANHNDVAPACVVVTIEGSASDYTLLASMKTSGNKAFKLKWTAVTGAEGYDVFLGDCGGGECELKKTVTGLSCKIGKLKKGNAYKAFVKAWKTENGQKVYIGEASPDVHAVAGGKSNKYTNAKKISVKKKKLTVAVGGSKKIKASLKKFSNSRRYLNHTAKIRYFSSNRAVATVNAKGKVTGVAPGTCTVYAVAENGLRKGVKITVK